MVSWSFMTAKDLNLKLSKLSELKSLNCDSTPYFPLLTLQKKFGKIMWPNSNITRYIPHITISKTVLLIQSLRYVSEIFKIYSWYWWSYKNLWAYYLQKLLIMKGDWNTKKQHIGATLMLLVCNLQTRHAYQNAL